MSDNVRIPKLIATSVIRGSEKGQSHGGVYLIDFERQSVEQKIDWNSGDIDFSGRGWDRGLRGIELTANEIWIAASDELFCYSPDFELIESFRNPYLKHCHEISRKDNLLFLTSTGFDSILAFDLTTKAFIWGLYVSKNGSEWVGQTFDPRARGGPAFVNSYHINMIRVDTDGISFSGLNTQALLAVAADMSISEICSLPRGCHNAMPFGDGIIFNDTASNAVRHVMRTGDERRVAVPTFPLSELEFMGVDDSKVARQGFGRGLCVINDQLVAAGSSPSTISIIDVVQGKRLTAVNLTMDIRNAIHGLECWPAEWP